MISRYTRGLVAATCVCAAACSSACPRPLVGNSSGVVVVLDYSKSFAPYSVGDVAALTEVNKSVLQMIRTGSLPQPVKILWVAFGDNGLRPLAPCGPPRVFNQKLTGRQNGSPDDKIDHAEPLTHIDKLESWLSVCVTAVRATSQSAQHFTDISGALVFAADALEDIREDRVVVLFTDLLEDLPPNRERPSFKLPNAKVLLVWRPGLDDQKQPAAVPERIELWRRRLDEAGASRVCAKAAPGLTEGEISNCLWKQER